MGIIRALTDSISNTINDQWLDVITVSQFDEHTVVLPGFYKNPQTKKNKDVITSGSKILVPENTAAFIFSGSKIENIITDAGVYEYQLGEYSIFNGDDFDEAVKDKITEKFRYGGVSSETKKVIFVNLREIRNIRFGTKGPQIYNDIYYGCDLEIFAYGSFSLKVVDPVVFIKNFVPANVDYYSFDDKSVRGQLLSDFIQSFIVALNSLSQQYRIAQLPSLANEISQAIKNDKFNAGSWKERFGFEIVQVSIENIELSDNSRNLVNQFNSNKMNVKAYEDVSQKAANIAAQQKIASGIQKHGLGEAASMVYGVNMAQNISGNGSIKQETLSLDQQIEMIKKLKDLLDCGILTQEEFDKKKKEIMGL